METTQADPGKGLVAVDDLVTVYATFPDRAAALLIAEEIVREGLAACVNVLGEITSVYVWEGKHVQSAEVAALFKTRRGSLDALVARVVERHPYDTPAVLVLPVLAGSGRFVAWVRDQSRSNEPKGS